MSATDQPPPCVSAGSGENPAEPRASIDSPAFRLTDAHPRRATDLRLPFANGTYRFALPAKQLAELERERGAGAGAIYGRLAQGRALLATGGVDWGMLSVAAISASNMVEADCLAVIRLALIGGGEGEVNGERVEVKPSRAAQLIDAYVAGQPLEDVWTYAFAALGARLCGAPAPAEGDGGEA